LSKTISIDILSAVWQYFFFSFELLQIAINYFYFKKNGIKKKNAAKSAKQPFQAKSLTLKLNPQPYFNQETYCVMSH